MTFRIGHKILRGQNLMGEKIDFLPCKIFNNFLNEMKERDSFKWLRKNQNKHISSRIKKHFFNSSQKKINKSQNNRYPITLTQVHTHNSKNEKSLKDEYRDSGSWTFERTFNRRQDSRRRRAD